MPVRLVASGAVRGHLAGGSLTSLLEECGPWGPVSLLSPWVPRLPVADPFSGPKDCKLSPRRLQLGTPPRARSAQPVWTSIRAAVSGFRAGPGGPRESRPFAGALFGKRCFSVFGRVTKDLFSFRRSCVYLWIYRWRRSDPREGGLGARGAAGEPPSGSDLACPHVCTESGCGRSPSLSHDFVVCFLCYNEKSGVLLNVPFFSVSPGSCFSAASRRPQQGAGRSASFHTAGGPCTWLRSPERLASV